MEHMEPLGALISIQESDNNTYLIIAIRIRGSELECLEFNWFLQKIMIIITDSSW